MKIIIAEKPSLGRAIASVIGVVSEKNGYTECRDDFVVTWCFGHLLELKSVEDYNPDYKQWDKRPLPFLPERWERKVSGDKGAQVPTIKKLIAGAKVVINAGDPDREGAMLVDSLISFVGWKGDVWRLLIADTTPKAVKRSIEKMDKYNSTAKSAAAADARAKADWLYGINMTTGFTLAARSQGYSSMVNIGRVQTPVLGLIVRRTQEIENFVSHPFYGVVANLHKDLPFVAKAKIEAAESYFDSENRLIEKSVADQLVKSCQGKEAICVSVKTDESKSAAPLLYSLSALQKDANKKYGLTATETLEAAQTLYEKGYTSYPRTDSNYITNEIWAEAPGVLTALESVSEFAKGADRTLKHSCVNDAKASPHYAIIPTDHVATGLNKAQQQIYDLIVTRFISIFYPPAVDKKTSMIFDIGGNEFTADGVVEIARGWRDVVKATDDEKEKGKILPKVNQGEKVSIESIEVVTKNTTPPKAFTEETLLGAMTGIAKYVTDESLKTILKETDGLGTEATRASIIENLVKREYVSRQKKNLIPTEKGVELITQLPAVTTQPDLTAKWELDLSQIENGELSVSEFLSSVYESTKKLLENPTIKITGTAAIEGELCPACGKPSLRRLKRKEGGFFWSCTKECGFKCNDKKGKPAEKAIHHCPKCNEKLTAREGKNGWWWSCNGFKNGCKFSADDARGKPVERVQDANSDDKSECTCPDCGKPMRKRKGQYGEFWGCTGYPDCKKILKLDQVKTD